MRDTVSEPGLITARDLRIEPRYVPRPARFITLHSVDDWRLKVYGLSMPGSSARPELVQAALKRADRVLPRPAVTGERYGVGFVIAHDAMTTSFALIYWWQSGNELHQRCFAAPRQDPGAQAKLVDPGAGCVFELGIIDFERRAWIDDIIGDPHGPDLTRYLSRRLNADV
jgi:hypothetical protein